MMIMTMKMMMVMIHHSTVSCQIRTMDNIDIPGSSWLAHPLGTVFSFLFLFSICSFFILEAENTHVIALNPVKDVQPWGLLSTFWMNLHIFRASDCVRPGRFESIKPSGSAKMDLLLGVFILHLRLLFLSLEVKSMILELSAEGTNSLHPHFRLVYW